MDEPLITTIGAMIAGTVIGVLLSLPVAAWIEHRRARRLQPMLGVVLPPDEEK